MAKKTEKKSSELCGCISGVVEKMREHNMQLVRGFEMNFDNREVRLGRPQIMVEKVAKSNKPIMTVLCTYCPFCGTKYLEE